MVEFTVKATETGSSATEEYVFGTMLDASKEFCSQWRYLIDMQDFREGEVTSSGLSMKFVGDDGFVRKVWVEIDQAQEF